MSADLLRKAAEILRERATAATPPADPEPGGWAGFSAAQDTSDGRAHLYGGPAVEGYRSTSVFEFCSWTDCEDCSRPSAEDVLWFETMHPGVGIALADLMDEAAQWGCAFDGDEKVHALARLIVGEQS